MAEFLKPSSGKIKKLPDDSFEIVSYKMDKILSPYDGRVMSVSNNICGGQIIIEHNFNGNYLVSNFCNVETILVSKSERVISGQAIGRFGSSPINYKLEDSRGNRLNAKNFFGTTDDVEEKKPGGKSEEKPEEKPEEYTGGKSGFKVTKGLTVGHQLFADLLGSPGNILKGKKLFKPGKLFQSKKLNKESIEFERLLAEEIKKIKSLLR